MTSIAASPVPVEETDGTSFDRFRRIEGRLCYLIFQAVLDTVTNQPYDRNVRKHGDGPWTLQELAGHSEVPPRTIRFYIARGALDGPAGAGRAASYSRAHLDRLREILRRQDAGETIAEIARGPVSLKQAGDPEAWWRFAVAPDVSVEVKQNLAPWRMNRVREALEEMVRRLKED